MYLIFSDKQSSRPILKALAGFYLVSGMWIPIFKLSPANVRYINRVKIVLTMLYKLLYRCIFVMNLKTLLQMETILINVQETSQAVKDANKARLANKNKWYQLKFIKGNNNVILKCYGTWIQLCTKPLFTSAMEQTPTQFKETIKKGIEKL